MKEVYANDGTMLAASTVASFYKNQTLIGSLREKLLLCDVLYVWNVLGGLLFGAACHLLKKCH